MSPWSQAAYSGGIVEIYALDLYPGLRPDLRAERARAPLRRVGRSEGLGQSAGGGLRF